MRPEAKRANRCGVTPEYVADQAAVGEQEAMRHRIRCRTICSRNKIRRDDGADSMLSMSPNVLRHNT